MWTTQLTDDELTPEPEKIEKLQDAILISYESKITQNQRIYIKGSHYYLNK